MEVYFHEHVRLVKSLHDTKFIEGETIGEYLNRYAENLSLGFEQKKHAVFVDISNYYRPLFGKSKDELFSLDLKKKDYLEISSFVHGYGAYSSVRNLEEKIAIPFEYAVDTLLNGKTKELELILDQNSELVNQSSQFGHQAQLIHYCASNAVEIYRQVVPQNLLEIIQLLISNGADPYAKIPVYGGLYDFFQLFSTSAHPKAAGVDQLIYDTLEWPKP